MNNIVLKPKLDAAMIAIKRANLVEISNQLKSEFFGIDSIIDKIIDAISAWYIFPEIVTRPVIINLWGPTGVGKTQVVRRLASLLKFSEQFVEVQMDGGSVTSSYNANSLTKLLGESRIEEGQPGILLLDEIQRFRTVDDSNQDVKLERFQDLWTLLSDGKFSADSALFAEMEMMMAYREWQQDHDDSAEKKDDDGKPIKPKTFKVYPYEAKSLKKLLRLTIPVSEIMKWDAEQTAIALEQVRSNRLTWEIDYSKLLIFISGNLDSAFTGSGSTDDCDTDADFYHELTLKVTATDIKRNLRRRFRPEQISRLGNNHIIYPSMSKRSYEQLIRSTCKRYVDEMTAVSDINFNLDESLYREIYNNSVYATQGTRPVFSSIHMIFSSVLVNATFWALEQNINDVSLAMTPDVTKVIATDNRGNTTNFAITLELNDKKAKTSIDMKTLVAVHEAGHALVYAKLTNASPIEIKVNPSSFEGGYMLPSADAGLKSKQDLLDKICIFLAGTASEEVVFGEGKRTSGAASDINQATQTASLIIRRFGLNDTLAMIEALSPQGTSWVSDLNPSNKAIENIMQQQFTRAKTLIADNMMSMRRIVDLLLEKSTITQPEFIELMASEMTLTTEPKLDNYHEQWRAITDVELK